MHAFRCPAGEYHQDDRSEEETPLVSLAPNASAHGIRMEELRGKPRRRLEFGLRSQSRNVSARWPGCQGIRELPHEPHERFDILRLPRIEYRAPDALTRGIHSVGHCFSLGRDGVLEQECVFTRSVCMAI
jgi:hypothetical protein